MNKSLLHKLASATLALSLLAMEATAGIVDTVPGRFADFKQGKVIFTVTGVLHNSAGLETVFICTNMNKAITINIGIEIFNYAGALQNIISEFITVNDRNYYNGAVMNIRPGSTATFVTDDGLAFNQDGVIRTAQASIPGGGARIVSTSAAIICTAAVAAFGSPPYVMMQLPIIKGLVQKGN